MFFHLIWFIMAQCSRLINLCHFSVLLTHFSNSSRTRRRPHWL
jgi:hypothetical protein